MDINLLLRENLKNFKAYSSARDEYSGKEGVFLDANENSLGSVTEETFNRYPDPYQNVLKKKIASIKKVAVESIFLGNGSDEAIDLLYRAFCDPGKDNVIIMPPSYGMYSVCAALNNVKIVDVPLTEDFQIDLEKLNKYYVSAKLIFICSPNNPSANLINPEHIKIVLKRFNGLVVVDEAYQDFTGQKSWLESLDTYENLVVLHTFSKAWGMAALRLGMAFAHPAVIKILSKIKYPYNINELTQRTVLKALDNISSKDAMVEKIIAQRTLLIEKLSSLNIVKNIFQSDANFVLVQFDDPKMVYQKLREKKIIVRDRSSLVHCDGCLRITVGKEEENQILINTLKGIVL